MTLPRSLRSFHLAPLMRNHNQLGPLSIFRHATEHDLTLFAIGPCIRLVTHLLHKCDSLLLLSVSISVAWFAFTVCMSAGVSTLNNYTKKVLMVGPRRTSGLNSCSFNFVGLLPPYYTPANPAFTLACPPSPPRISHLSPYYEPPSAKLPASAPRLTHSHSLPLAHSDSFPPPPSHPAPASPFHRLSLPSPSPSPSRSVHLTLPGHREDRYEPEEDYSPL